MIARVGGLLLAAAAVAAGPSGAQVPGLAPESPYSLGGYVKYLGQVAIPHTGDRTVDHVVNQRFNFEYRWDQGLSLTAGMRNRVFLGDALDLPGFSC